MHSRTSKFLALAAVVGIAIAAWYVSRRPGEAAVAASAPVPGVVQPAAMSPVVNATTASTEITADAVARWIADSTGGDADKRATAIAALANAPRADAVPVLRRILTDGEPQVDRPLALSSLRELALTQGDGDGAIRDAVRQAIYHGDDFTRTDDAQDVLDTIEESELK